MIEKYEDIYAYYKKFIEENSQYGSKVVKYNTSTSTYFPLVTCLSNIIDSDESTKDKIEYFDAFYFTIEVYTKDKTIGTTVVASQVINDELTRLTIQFFGEKLNMKRTLCKPTPNLDNGILRRTIQYQCLIGNARGNIIRR